MGVLENESRKRSRNRNIQRAVLGTAALAGGVALAMVAPNALSLLKHLPGWKAGKNQNRVILNARARLLKAGLLEFRSKKLFLTSKGKFKLRQLELNDFKIKKPRKWDEKWRVLIFDISEKRKSLRYKIRLTLIAIGFIRLQDSVWVYPYDCEDLVTLLKVDFKIGRDLLYMIVDFLENDIWLRKKFNLPF